MFCLDLKSIVKTKKLIVTNTRCSGKYWRDDLRFFQFSILLTSEQCQKPFFCCLMINMIKCRGTHYHPLQSGEFPIGCTSIPMIQHDPPSDFREFWEIFGTLFGKSVSSSILQIRQAQSQTLPSWGLWHSTRSSVPGTIRGGCDLFFYLGGSRSSNIE